MSASGNEKLWISDTMHDRGYRKEGTTTPFERTVLNDLSRFPLDGEVIDRVPRLRNSGGHVRQHLPDKLNVHKRDIVQHGNDVPGMRDCGWPE